MGKLHLKRTPEEQAARDLRKARKAARKAMKRSRPADLSGQERSRSASPPRRRSYFSYGEGSTKRAEHELPGHKPDYDYIKAQVEEERFREKMWGAFGDDERLDSVEATLNSYAHVPRRWRSGGMERMDDELDIDPQMMEEEDYAEWVRASMWRKKHAAEHAEQELKKAERAARLEREKALREETARMEKAEEERRRQRRSEKERLRWVDARDAYEIRWKDLLGITDEQQDAQQELRFEDIPWPVMVIDVGPSLDKKGKGRAEEVTVDLEDLTVEAISAFLLPGGRIAENTTSDRDVVKKERRDKLRETMLRFHPDKFEGRILHRVHERDKERVRDAVGRVARAINELLVEKAK
ncbi:hypothetical protein EW026_g6269 [Hermanssonia centrifuga]|uniref:Uncharacterized protein n=1 Tax=Hermanssonia centrifuga TaxID=98765 RepID=A0A4S4KBH5_9APHY|nr:hypothetical protein EW026_g6269 [Hermanssonia centrifuga]